MSRFNNDPVTTNATPAQKSPGSASPKIIELAVTERKGAAYDASAMRDTLPNSSPWFQHAYPAAIEPIAARSARIDPIDGTLSGTGAPDVANIVQNTAATPIIKKGVASLPFVMRGVTTE